MESGSATGKLVCESVLNVYFSGISLPDQQFRLWRVCVQSRLTMMLSDKSLQQFKCRLF